MSDRSDYQDEMAEKLDEWSARLASLLDKTTEAEKAAFLNKVDQWKSAGIAALAKLGELKRATGDNWDIVREEMGTIWQAIVRAMDHAEARRSAGHDATKEAAAPIDLPAAPSDRK